MNCDDVRDELGELIDSRLDEPAATAIEAHVAACAPCARALAGMRLVVAALAREAAATPLPGDLAERLLSRVPRPAPRSRWLDARRVAGWGLVLLGLSWQLGGGALAARAMTEAAPVVADARQAMARVRTEGGLAAEVGRSGEGLVVLARDLRDASRLMDSRESRP